MTAVLPDAVFTDLAATAAADGIQQLVVGAAITRNRRILLLQRPADDFMGGIWELPSGKTEPGETLPAALAREVTEETGLHITAITSYLGHFDYTSGSGKLSRQFTFTVDIAAPEPITLTEHDACNWADPATGLPVTDAVKTVLAPLSA